MCCIYFLLLDNVFLCLLRFNSITICVFLVFFRWLTFLITFLKSNKKLKSNCLVTRLRVVVLSQTSMTSLVSWSSLPQLTTDPWTLFEKTVNLVTDSTLESRKSMNSMCKNNLAHRLQELESAFLLSRV